MVCPLSGDGGAGKPVGSSMAGEAASRKTQPVDVAAAVLTRPDGSVLLAQRPREKVYAGYWEFPGGKVEPGETVAAALKREIHEELGVEVQQAYPWITQVFQYPHATVRLHFFRVTAWRGVVVAQEHEGLAWEQPQAVGHFPSVDPLLPANGPVLRALALPTEYAISHAAALGEGQWLERLRLRLGQGLRLIQVREPEYTSDRLERLAAKVVEMARPGGARVLVNHDVAVARRVGADGVQLTARQLGQMKERPQLDLVGASCHNAAELRAAEKLGADFAVLGPVRSTPSHPDRAAMGWQEFGKTASGAALPVYALGGVVKADLETAWTHGAHGVAMVRGAWNA